MFGLGFRSAFHTQPSGLHSQPEIGMLYENLSVRFLLARYTKLSFMTRSSVFERVMISQLTDCNAIHVRAFLTVIGGHITFDMYPHGALQVFHWASRWQIDHY